MNCPFPLFLQLVQYCMFSGLLCRSDHLDVVGYLVNEAHCDPNVKSKRGETPLHRACRLIDWCIQPVFIMTQWTSLYLYMHILSMYIYIWANKSGKHTNTLAVCSPLSGFTCAGKVVRIQWGIWWQKLVVILMQGTVVNRPLSTGPAGELNNMYIYTVLVIWVWWVGQFSSF